MVHVSPLKNWGSGKAKLMPLRAIRLRNITPI
jgi:hypothetical protein